MENDVLKVALDAARRAGKVLMASYGKLLNSQISTKSKNDFVTVVDKKSENLIISSIKKNFPSHAIQGEESGITGGKDTLWIIDPLDGTSNYIHNIPIFSVSIGVMKNNRMIAGVIYDPVHKEMFWTKRGQGSYLNNKKIHVTKIRSLSESLMTTGIPFRARDRFDEYMESFRRISLGSVGLRRGGSAALDLAYVACGRFEGFWELDLSPWDIAAGSLILEEAGGTITDMWGGGNHFKNGDILATNGLTHKELLKITSAIFTPSDKDKRCHLN